MQNKNLKVAAGIISTLLTCCTLCAQEIRVEDLQFKNNKRVSSGKLKKAIQTQANPWYRLFLFWKASKIFNEEIFLSDLLRIEKYYHQEGYLEARVKDYKLHFNRKHDEVNIVVVLDEGELTKVNRVNFVTTTDSLAIPEKKLKKMLKLKQGKGYREVDLTQDYHKIVKRFNNQGYPYIVAKVRPVVDKQAHLVDLQWDLDPGPFSHFGEIRIAGNENISDKVILRGLGFQPGKRFTQSQLANAQNQVYRLELFQFVSLRAVTSEQRRSDIPIEVRVKESTLRTLKFGLGYGSEESFRTFVRWRHRNFLGGGRILRILAKHSTNVLPLQLELELSQPYFLDNRNDLSVKPFFVWQEERSFKARRIGLETTFHRQLTRRTNTFIRATIERDTVDVKVDNPVPEAEDLFNKSVLRIGIQRNSTDQLFNPSRGSIATASAEEAGRFLSTPFRYLKLSGEYRKFKQFKTGQIFAWRLLVGSMRPIRGSNITPVEERFFSGGSYSVRGWGRQLLGPLQVSTTADTANARIDTTIVPQGGNSIIEASFELRFPLYKHFAGAIFLDCGNVWSDWDDFDVFDLRYAVGAGLRYNTFIGPVRIDFAWKLNKQPLDQGRFQLHVSLGRAF